MMQLDQLFFTQTLLGKPIDTIGIWLSGGADSSLLCYMLADKLIRENHNIKILPISVQKRPGEMVTAEVLAKIKELLDAEHVFKDHLMYRNPEDWREDAEYRALFKQKHHEHLIDGRYQCVVSGITCNTSHSEQTQVGQPIIQEVEVKRGLDVVKDLIKYSAMVYEGQVIEDIEFRPFFNVNKKGIAAKYAELDLLDTLFPVTKSCENRDMLEGHCGECWWCLERLWAFGKL